MTTQNAPRTARQRARAELTREITEEARRQLAATGANGLSLRAVARELGMVSSALYRYLPKPRRSADRADHRRLQRHRRGGGDRHRRDKARSRRRRRPRPVAGRLPRHPRLGARPPARVRADLRFPGPRLPRPGGDDRPGRPGAARVGRRAGRRDRRRRGRGRRRHRRARADRRAGGSGGGALGRSLPGPVRPVPTRPTRPTRPTLRPRAPRQCRPACWCAAWSRGRSCSA